MKSEESAARMLARERMRVVNRQYDLGGWMIALQALTIEVDGQPLVIPAGHRLTWKEALNYPGDVQRASDQRTARCIPELAYKNIGRRHGA
jgi:hypothetical protein